MDHPALKVENLQVSFGDDVILKDVSLHVDHGETLVIIGPSGSGKSVLLKSIAGILPPVKGHVFVEGEDWQNLESDEKHDLARKVGVLFQKNALFDSMSAAENIAFPLKEHTDLSEKERDKIACELLEAVGISDAHDKMPHELSGGMRRRLGIARALALNPEILFYDDPTAGLDPVTTEKICDLILDLKKKHNSTLVVVTSDMATAYLMADRIVMVWDQELIEVGTPEQAQASQDPRVHQFIMGELQGPLTDKRD